MEVVTDRLPKTLANNGSGVLVHAKVLSMRKFVKTVKVFQVDQEKEKFFTQGDWATYLDRTSFPINTSQRSIPIWIESSKCC
jgi:hypothetical protein